MAGKKGSSPPLPPRVYRKELEYLYARRAAVEELIRTLEEYHLYQPFAARRRKRRPE